MMRWNFEKKINRVAAGGHWVDLIFTVWKILNFFPLHPRGLAVVPIDAGQWWHLDLCATLDTFDVIRLSYEVYNKRDNMVDLNRWVMFFSKIKMPLLLVYWPLSGSKIFRHTSITCWGPPWCPSRCTPRSSGGWRRKYQVWHINQDAIIDRHL